jgi:predicted metal-dependent TIM-barrel fold hydrolase
VKVTHTFCQKYFIFFKFLNILVIFIEECVIRLLQGIIDMHVHAAPDIYPRKCDEIELVREMKFYDMRGVLLKSHHTLTADRAWLIRKIEPDFKVFGSLTLNIPATGGLNPQAVETAIKFGAKEIWMPTISSAHHLRYEGKDPVKGIRILTEKNELVSEVIEILNLIAEANVILGTGHLSIEESRVLVAVAKKMGVKKILVTHPEWELVNMPIEVQIELAKEGAFMEHCYYATTTLGGGLNPQEIARQIKAVGAEHCVMATDLGQKLNPSPVDGMMEFIESMMKYGISKEEIETMTKKNPAKLLDLSTK